MCVLALALATAASSAAVDLGTAGLYAGAALNGQLKFTVSNSGTNVWGNVFVGDGPSSPDMDFSGGGEIFGTIYKHPSAVVNISGGSSATGGVVAKTVPQTTQIATDLSNALAQVAGLTATQASLGDYHPTGTADIYATVVGLNVVDATNIELKGGATLTFHGTTSDYFVLRCSSMQLGDLITTGNSNISADGMGAGHLLFVVDNDITMSGGVIDGTYISKFGNITLSDGTHYGSYILAAANKELKFQSAPQVHYVGFVIPEPGSLLAFASGLVGLAGFALRKRR